MDHQITGRRAANSVVELRSANSVMTWLRNYYLGRAAFSVAWVAGSVVVGRNSHVSAVFLLVAYPAWDAVANYFDAESNGGWHRNPTQTLNIVVSALTTGAVAIALEFSMNAVIGV